MRREVINIDSRDLEGDVLYLKNRINNIRQFRVLTAEIPNSLYVIPPEQTLSVRIKAENITIAIKDDITPLSFGLSCIPSISDLITFGPNSKTANVYPIADGNINCQLDLNTMKFVFRSEVEYEFSIECPHPEFARALGILPNVEYMSTDRTLTCPNMIDFNSAQYLYINIAELRPYMLFQTITGRDNKTDDGSLLRIQMSSDFGKYVFSRPPFDTNAFINVRDNLNLDKLTISLTKYGGVPADLNGLAFSLQLEIVAA